LATDAEEDTLYGEQQNDVLIAGSGDDVLWATRPNALLARGMATTISMAATATSQPGLLRFVR